VAGGWSALAGEADAFQAHIAEVRRVQRERRRAEADAVERAAYTGLCYDCQDTGWWDIDVPCDCPRGRAIAEERRMGQVRAIWREASIPLRQKPLRLETYPAKQLAAYAKVREWLGDFDGSRGLLLIGPFSTGKTGLATGCLYEVAGLYAGTPYRVRFAVTVDFLEAMRPSNRNEKERDSIMHDLQRVRCLLLDDLGKDKSSEYVQRALYELVNYRYNHQLPTLVTSNNGADELAERVGEAVVDRLAEMCRWVKMDADAPNLRRPR
jgi:DNA replication protein DnaC